MNALKTCLLLAAAFGISANVAAAETPPMVAESARAIPVVYDVDVVVVGGSTGGVSAAIAAAQAGAKVFLAAPRPYLGEDMGATLRLWLEEGETPASPLARQIFSVQAEPPAAAAPPKDFARLAKPLHVKRTLDQALLAAKVDFLFGCYATEILRDDAGNPCGVVIANRSGRQAVLAKVLIDATDRAWVARMAGAQFQPYPRGPQTFTRVVVGGEPKEGEGLAVRKVGLSFAAGAKRHDVFEYTIRVPMAGGSWAALAEAD